MYQLYHKRGFNPCGGLVLTTTQKPHPFDILRSENCFYPDGSSPKAGDRIICSTCGGLVEGFGVDDCIEIEE